MGARKTSIAAVITAWLAAFAFSLLWYSPLLFGRVWTNAQGPQATAMATWKFFVAPLRELITAWFLAWLMGRLAIADWKSAVRLGFLLWLVFYVVQLGGAVIFDGMPPALGAVHAGDWLVKLLIMALVLNAWRGPRQTAA